MKLNRILFKVMLLSASFIATYNCYAQELVGNPKVAQSKVAMCIGCHAIPEYKASFPLVYSVPLLGGQNAAYIAKALKAYQSGDRKHPTMQSIASSLSDQDIADLATYYGQQTIGSANSSIK
jgi:cytochrome c553